MEGWLILAMDEGHPVGLYYTDEYTTKAVLDAETGERPTLDYDNMERIYIASAEELENAAYPGTDRLLFALLPEANFYILDADENSGELFYVLSNDVKRISDPPLWLNFFVLPWRKKKYTPRERKARISAEKDFWAPPWY